MRQYPHLMAKLFNVPLMVDPAKANAILAALSSKLGLATNGTAVEGPALSGQQRPRMEIPGARYCAGGYLITREGVAIVTISGTTVHSAAGAYPPSGMTSYSEIRDQIEAAAADSSVRAVLMAIDSPGGEASDSAFALSDRIRQLRSTKPIWGVADEMACSAGYLLLSGAEKVFGPRQSYLGSIGAYALHLDMSAADKMEGLVWTYIKAGAHKAEGNEHQPIPDAFRARVQADVDATYARFVTQVGANRPSFGADGARKTEAQFYRGDEALALGLTDGIADFDTVLKTLSTSLSNVNSPGIQMSGPSSRQEASAETATGAISPAAAAEHQETEMNTPENTTASAGTKPAVTAAATATGDPAASNVVDLNTVRKEAGQAATAQAAEIAELCTLAGKPALAAGFIAEGKSKDDVRKALLSAQTTGDKEIAAHAPGLPSGQKTAIDHRGIFARFNSIKK